MASSDVLFLPPFTYRPSSARDDSGGPASLLDRRASKRLNLCSFQPLPSIVASPISTPIPTVPQPNSLDSQRVLFPTTPTWIATPPTPPPRTSIRRSNTTNSTRRAPTATFSPSTSFPASMQPHGEHDNIIDNDTPLKRCVSVPDLSLRPKVLAGSFVSVMSPRVVQSPDALDNPFDLTFSVHVGTGGPRSYTRRREGTYVRPIFHLDNDDDDDDKHDDASIYDKIDVPSPEEVSPAGSWSDHDEDDEDLWETERAKDALRRFHALRELLDTEVGYLMDLKALVTVYLRNLPTLSYRSLTSISTFGRASSSFTSGPWMHSYTQLQAAALASSTNLSDSPGTPTTPTPINQSKTRYLFSDSELELLTRNAEEILYLHEQFVRELRALLEPLDFGMEVMAEDYYGCLPLKNLDAAIRVVSAKFATEASRFKAYQSFCAGHAMAMDIMRKAYQQYPLELDAYESRSSNMANEMMELGTKPSASEPKPATTAPSSARTSMERRHNSALTVDDRKRAMSLTSLDGAARSLRPRASMILVKDLTTFPPETRPREKTNSTGNISTASSNNPPRIAFMDYMIKPIQRICKYPLLLDQLLPAKALRTLAKYSSSENRSSVDVVVESAAQAMRHVAAAVDEARHRQNIATQSALIVSRISLGTTFGTSSSATGMIPLTAEFISSLGDCLLSGSLDVMHYNLCKPLGQNSSIKVKYLGAFLYSGGYLLLVKVSKGKKYEPRHWFSLTDFEVEDVEDGGAMLPCSFKLLSGDKHFELAAACHREKDAWLSSIHEALHQPPSWTTEPTPSYRFDEKGELLPESEETPVSATLDPQPHSQPSSCNSMIQCVIPEMGGSDSEATAVEPFFATLRGHGKAKQQRKRAAVVVAGHEHESMPLPPSRRSSSTSVKAIFSPMTSDTETVVIRRSSHAARGHVDHELQDIISQSCLTARSYAFTHEQTLFQAPRTQKAARTGFPRSNSGIGMAGMARLSKHESVRVPRRKPAETFDSVSKSAVLSVSTASRRLNTNKLSINSLSETEQDQNDRQQQQRSSRSSPSPSPSPSPPAYRPSIRNRVSSLRDSENDSFMPSGSNESISANPKSRSFARGVRGLFQFRPLSPSSPVSAISSHQNQTLNPMHPELLSHNSYAGTIHRWAHKSLRRRARSVSDEPLFDNPEKQFVLTSEAKTTPSPLST